MRKKTTSGVELEETFLEWLPMVKKSQRKHQKVLRKEILVIRVQELIALILILEKGMKKVMNKSLKMVNEENLKMMKIN